jgi:methylase of polypeptide subunit release factors
VDQQTYDHLDFGGLDIRFDDRVLHPREWTIAQSRWAAELLEPAPDGPVLELFAGVGHIGLAAVVATERRLVQVDLNPVACDLARHNAEAAGLSDRVEVREGRIDAVLGSDERFRVVIADPPWVPSSGVHEFPDDPSIAIDGGSDGLDLARTCCSVIDRHLDTGGAAVLQVGTPEQARAVDGHLSRTSTSGLRVADTREHERGVLALLARGTDR